MNLPTRSATISPITRALLIGGALVGLNLYLTSLILRGHVLYLGGDSAQPALFAWEFLRTGRLDWALIAPYEDGVFNLALIPFLLLFGHTTLCLKIAAISASAATVALLYVFLLRSYGNGAAAAVGLLYASSPLLLSHCAWGPLYMTPLWSAAILCLDTFTSPRARAAKWTAVGFLLGSHAYFILPLIVFVLWRGVPSLPESARGKAAAFGGFALGLAPLAYRLLLRTGGLDTSLWLSDLLISNASRWRDPTELAAAVWRQWSWSLDSLHFYHPVAGSSLIDAVTLTWAGFYVAALAWVPTRRLAAALLAGAAASALVQSTHGALGLRHVLAFMPFQWLPLAPMFAAARGKRARALSLAFVGLLAGRQIYNDVAFSFWSLLGGGETRRHLEYIARRIEELPHGGATIAAADDNAAVALRYLCAGRDIRLIKADTKLTGGAGIILLSSRPPDTLDELASRAHTNLGWFNLTGRTRYSVRLEKGAADPMHPDA